MNRKSNKLISLLTTLDKAQRRSCRKLIQSPMFSGNAVLLALFDDLVKRLDGNKSLDKQLVWVAVVGSKKTFNDARFRKYTSDLFKLLKEYLIQESLTSEPELRQYLYLSALEKQRTNKLIRGVERNWDDLVAIGDATEATQFLYQHLLELKKHALLKYGQRPNDRSNLEDISQSLDLYFIISKLKNAVEARSRGVNDKQVYNLRLIDEVIDFLDRDKTYLDEPLVVAYLYIYKMLGTDNPQAAYYAYKDIILGNNPKLSLPPKYVLLLPALNFCVVTLLQGQRQFMEEYLEIYKFGLANGIAFADDSLDPRAFKNTVQIAMQTGDFEWAENYIRTYQDKLPDSDRVNTVNYNLASVYFYQKKFSEAQDYLSLVEYTNIDLNLNAKLLLLAIYYELGEDTVLESFFDSTISYLNRHKELVSTKDRTIRNLVIYTRRLTRLLPNDRAGYEKLKADVEGEKYLASKSWLEQKIKDFKTR